MSLDSAQLTGLKVTLGMRDGEGGGNAILSTYVHLNGLRRVQRANNSEQSSFLLVAAGPDSDLDHSIGTCWVERYGSTLP